MKKVKAVLMAGGFGTRIMPLTTSIPKPMLPITNIPMMETIIQRLIEVGIDEVVILLYYKPDVIKNYFQDGKKWGIKIDYVLPDDDYGTAGAVGCAREFLDTTFMVVSGDVINDFDLKSILDFHFEKESKLTITLTRVDNPLQFGVVVTNKDNRIVKFLEKPSWGEVFSDTINTGLYVIEPEVLKEIPEEENFDFSKDLFPTLMKKDVPLWGFDAKGYWRDVGNPVSYLELHKDIFDEKLKWNFTNIKDKFPKSVKVDGKVSIDKSVEIGDNSYISNSTISKNCKIGENCNIQDCVIWDNVIIKDNSILKDCIICNNVKIDNSFIAEKGCVIAEDTKIGKNVSIDKNITIWANKMIEDNSIISSNVVGDSKIKNTLFNQGKIIGVPNTEITAEMALKFAEAFGSTLPVGSTVYVSRDYARSSRMLKRLILGGLLSVGINVVDIEATPSSIIRYSLFKEDNISAAIHIRQSIHFEHKTDIMVFSSDAMPLGNKFAKDVEKIFFKENFRIVKFDEIGEITKPIGCKTTYIKGLEENLNFEHSKDKIPFISIDLMYGMVSDIYPDILSYFDIENVMINAYVNESKLTKISSTAKSNLKNLSKIVKSMKNDIGIALYPNAQKVEFVDNLGRIIPSHKMVMAIIYMMHLHDGKDYKVYLPAWAPEIFDEKFSDVFISRGSFMDKDVNFLTSFDLLANTHGNYAFTNFGIHPDGIYASLRVIEILYIIKRDLASIIDEMPDYEFKHIKMNVPSAKKGTVMRKFLEEAKDRKVSHIDGVKIYISNSDWILAIPDDYHDIVHLYIQAKDKTNLNKIKNEFTKYIESWIEK